MGGGRDDFLDFHFLLVLHGADLLRDLLVVLVIVAQFGFQHLGLCEYEKPVLSAEKESFALHGRVFANNPHRNLVHIEQTLFLLGDEL